MTPKQEQALREYLREAIVPLIEDVLAKKLGQAMTFAAQELIQPKRVWIGLTDEEMHACADSPWTPAGLRCVRAVEAALKAKNA